MKLETLLLLDRTQYYLKLGDEPSQPKQTQLTKSIPVPQHHATKLQVNSIS